MLFELTALWFGIGIMIKNLCTPATWCHSGQVGHTFFCQ